MKYKFYGQWGLSKRIGPVGWNMHGYVWTDTNKPNSLQINTSVQMKYKFR